jgi:hypothetical protein
LRVAPGPRKADEKSEALWKTADMDALGELRIIAVREALGEIVRADVLIATGLQAVLEVVESPTLPLLAELGRSEEGEAHDLFRRVADELDLAPGDAHFPSFGRQVAARAAVRSGVGEPSPSWCMTTPSSTPEEPLFSRPHVALTGRIGEVLAIRRRDLDLTTTPATLRICRTAINEQASGNLAAVLLDSAFAPATEEPGRTSLPLR